jgi:anti-sigma factor RsiW
MARDREIAGIRCMEVLEVLDDYLDDALDDQTRAQVESHLTECGWCATFGGRYAETVRQLRTQLLAEDTDDEDSAEWARTLLADHR